jgi:hypothetical protein
LTKHPHNVNNQMVLSANVVSSTIDPAFLYRLSPWLTRPWVRLTALPKHGNCLTFNFPAHPSAVSMAHLRYLHGPFALFTWHGGGIISFTEQFWGRAA